MLEGSESEERQHDKNYHPETFQMNQPSQIKGLSTYLVAAFMLDYLVQSSYTFTVSSGILLGGFASSCVLVKTVVSYTGENYFYQGSTNNVSGAYYSREVTLSINCTGYSGAGIISSSVRITFSLLRPLLPESIRLPSVSDQLSRSEVFFKFPSQMVSCNFSFQSSTLFMTRESTQLLSQNFASLSRTPALYTPWPHQSQPPWFQFQFQKLSSIAIYLQQQGDIQFTSVAGSNSASYWSNDQLACYQDCSLCSQLLIWLYVSMIMSMSCLSENTRAFYSKFGSRVIIQRRIWNRCCRQWLCVSLKWTKIQGRKSEELLQSRSYRSVVLTWPMMIFFVQLWRRLLDGNLIMVESIYIAILVSTSFAKCPV